jgi:hypothetical protein
VVKDVWVLSDELPSPTAPPPAPRRIRHQKRIADIVGSRAADVCSGSAVMSAVDRRAVAAGDPAAAAGGNLAARSGEIDLLTHVLYRSGWIPAAVAECRSSSMFRPPRSRRAARSAGGMPGGAAAAGHRAARPPVPDMWRTIGLVSGSMSGQPSPVQAIWIIAGAVGWRHHECRDLRRPVENMTRGAGWRFLEIAASSAVSSSATSSAACGQSLCLVELSVRPAFELKRSHHHATRAITESYSLPMLDLVLSDAANRAVSPISWLRFWRILTRWSA